MKALRGSILCLAFAPLLLSCGFKPELYEQPYLCGPGGACPDDYQCYGGFCRATLPACMDPTVVEFSGWPTVDELEPNNHPRLAPTLECLDEIHATTSSGLCPARQNYHLLLTALSICPGGDQDLYAFYLAADERMDIEVIHQVSATAPRNLDIAIWRYDAALDDYQQIAVASSLDDDEVLSISTASAGGSPPGWYYLLVYGANVPDINVFSVNLTLNP